MKRNFTELKLKYRQISDLTRPRCMEQCPEPGGCCTPSYCDLAEARAREFGMVLPAQHHPELKYMGAGGCVVPAYLRPLCAIHVCGHHVINDDAFAHAYLQLREEVCQTEEASGAAWPPGMARDYWE